MQMMNLPWRVAESPDFGLIIEDAYESCVAFFAYPGDDDLRHYNGARENAEAIVNAVNEKWLATVVQP